MREKTRKGFVKFHQAQVTHDLGPETCVEQVQHGVLDAADVLIHRSPIIIAFIDHRAVAVGRAVAHEVPGGVHEGIHRIGFTRGICPALRALALQERFALVERVAGAIGHEVCRQNYRQIFFRNRNRTAVRAVDNRNRGAPITLTADAPVADAELGLFFTQALGGERVGDFINTGVDIKAVEFTGIDEFSVVALIGVPLFPCIRGIGFAGHANDLFDRQAILLGKCEVTFVVCGDAHHGAFAVAH